MNRLLNESQIAEIEKIIQSYQPNPSVLKQFRKSNFAVIAGPAAAGKDTLRNALTDSDSYLPVLSTTTRPIRSGEVEGKTYYFTDYESVKDGLAKGKYFQAALVHRQQVSVLDVCEVEKLGPKKTGLSILIVQTEQELHRHKPDIKTIFLVPPGLDEMRKRLDETRSISAREVRRRLDAAKRELEYALSQKDYYFLVSDGYERVYRLADDFLQTGKRDNTSDKNARVIAKDLLKELKKLN